MAKRHTPRRYQEKETPKAAFALSGKVLLKYEDDEEIETAGQGDVFLYLHFERADRGMEITDYRTSGNAGYMKAMVHNGKGWKPLLTEAFFPGREHHFSKKERPWDTFLLCREMLQKEKGSPLRRSYREHYEHMTDLSE